MKSLFVICVLVILKVIMTEAQVVESYDPDSGHSSHCYSKDHDIEMSKGQELPTPNQCSMMVCTEVRDIQYIGCGVIPNSCPGDATAPFPKCCPQPCR